MKTVKDSHGIEYKEVNGTFFHASTDERVCNILRDYQHTNKRLKLYFGDADTGKDWNEEHDTVGRIGRSTGEIKIPLLLTSWNSYGGGAILDHCIVKIKDVATKRILWIHPKYNSGKVEIVPSDLPEYAYNVTIGGNVYSRHHSERAAKLLAAKLS